MTRFRRLQTVLTGLLLLGNAVYLFLNPDEGYRLLVLCLSLSLTLYGVHTLLYYFVMARFTVGGKSLLYRGFLVLEAGLFSLMAVDIPRLYIVIYLAGANLVSGGICIADALRSRKEHGASRKLKLAEGAVSIAVAVICVLFRNRNDILTYVYCLELLYAAGTRFCSAFRRNAIVYIQ